MERKGWEITIVQDDEWYKAICTSSSGKTITSSIYETEDEAIEAGCLLVDRAWEKEHGIKRQVLDLDVGWLIGLDQNIIMECNIALYVDLKTGKTVSPEDFEEDPNIDSEYLEFSDRYLSIPDFSDSGRDMEDFIDSIEDEFLQAIVAKAFYEGGRGRFRRVKDIVGWQWSAFEDERKEERLLRWLESENLELKSKDTTETASDNVKPKEEEPDLFRYEEFDPDKIKTERKKIQTSITKRQGQSKFRQDLVTIYGERCAISGSDVIECLEAAHIVPYAGEQTNHVANGLLLRADLHTLFDLNLITIDPDSKTVLIAPCLQGTYCEEFAGKKIYIPDKLESIISKKALKHHYQQCEWVNYVIPSECIAVVLEYGDTDFFKYHTALFQPMKLEGYDSIYWWTKEFLGQKYMDFDSARTQAMKFSQKQDIPLLWGVAHLVKAGPGTCAKIDKPATLAEYGLKIGYGVYPVDEQGNKLEFRSATTLKKELSLTAKQIKELGEPDRISKNPSYKNGSPMQLYLLARVKRQFPQSELGD